MPARDREAFERQRRALETVTSDDEGDDTHRAATIAAADARRVEQGRAPLEPWWSTKTEPELHERARALGLLDRVR